MTRDASIVQRLIAFFKKPDALNYNQHQPAPNPYDDYDTPPEVDHADVRSGYGSGGHGNGRTASLDSGDELLNDADRSPNYASRLDALVLRAIQQFNAHSGCVLRYENDGRMRYCTGRDGAGKFAPHTLVKPDRRAVYTTLDSGESQFFVHNGDDTPAAVLCGPLRTHDGVIGVLYLDNPSRSRLHRGIFDVFCDQAARLLLDNVS